MRSLGIKKEDRVIVFYPVVRTMLVIARLKAIHSVVFGGFAAKELASRLSDCQAKLIITASCGIEPHKIIDFKEIADETIKISKVENIKVFFHYFVFENFIFLLFDRLS